MSKSEKAAERKWAKKNASCVREVQSGQKEHGTGCMATIIRRQVPVEGILYLKVGNMWLWLGVGVWNETPSGLEGR